MTITISNETQLRAVMAVLFDNADRDAVAQTAQAPQQTKQEDAGAKKAKAQASTPAKTTEAPAHTSPTVEAAAAAAPESKAEDSAPAQNGNDEEQPWNAQDYKNLPEYQAVAKAVVEVAKVKGRESAAALLEKVAKVKSLPESLPSQGAAIIAAFQAEGV